MENIEFIEFCGLDRWKDAVENTGKYEGWILADEDLDRWREGFGEGNYNLLVAIEKKTNKTVGHVATAFYESIEGSDPLLTIGMFFVLPEFRGIGLGWKLFEKVVQNPKFHGINWGLNAIPKMTKKYATKFGFDKYPKWQISTFEAAIKDINPERLQSNHLIKNVSFKEVNFESFIKYDTVMTGGIRRDKFMEKWLDSKNAFSKIALNLENKKIVGVCNIRIAFQKQLAIGPFYAETKSIAENLLKDVLKIIPDINQYSKLWLYPATTNQEAKEIFYNLADGKIQEYNVSFGQFTKHVIEVNTSKIYSVTEHAMSYC
uniref:N-acetyltransferase domain-containing protein n=1 Tax=Panagrolaimus superbus TaxID=310955 RepID=A0A914Z831_9BILA